MFDGQFQPGQRLQFLDGDLGPVVIDLPLVSTYLSHANNGTDLTTYNFAAFTLPGATGSYVLVAAAASLAATPSVSSMSIDGQAATLVGGSGVGADVLRVEFWIAPSTANASGTISVTWNAAVARCAIAAWNLQNLQSTTLTNSAADTGLDPSVALNVDAGGGGFAMFYATDADSKTVTWTGLTERVDTLVETSRTYSAASLDFASAQVGLTVTADGSTAGATCRMFAIAMR